MSSSKSLISTSSMKQARFPTSEEIYSRLKTDPIFQQSEVEITYYDSVKDLLVNIPFCQWKSIKDGGDIPWHRVYFLKYQSEVIWDRQAKQSTIQILYERLLQESNSLREIIFPKSFQILTWNVLSDLYEKQVTNLLLRQEAIFQYLQSINCSMICLQEVTNDFYEALTIRFKEEYQIAKTDLKTNNIIFLSKIPFSSFQIISLNLNKQILCIQFYHLLQISIVHLTSSYHSERSARSGGQGSGNVSTKRNLQLSQLLQSLSKPSSSSSLSSTNGIDDVGSIIIGDFNTSDTIDLLMNASYREVPLTDYSYNPETNRLAKHLSQSQKKGKYDRLFYDCRQKSMNVHSCVVDTTQKSSDHYPVIFTVDYDTEKIHSQNASQGLSTNRILSTPNKYSLTIVLPIKFWQTITTISHRYSMNWDKWMPHIHLFFPFLEILTAEEASTIQRLFRQRKYFGANLKIEELAYFQHEGQRTTYTIYGKFTKENQLLLQQLQQEIADALQIEVISPISSEVRYHPHLTIASISSFEEMQRFIQNNQKQCQAIEFPLKRLCYLHNSHRNYYEVIDIFGIKGFEGNFIEFLTNYLPNRWIEEIKLGGSSVFNVVAEDEQKSDEKGETSEGEVKKELKIKNEGSNDYDLLVIGKVSREDFIDTTYKLLTTCGLFSEVRQILNQHTHYLKIITSFTHYDVHYINKKAYQHYQQLYLQKHSNLSLCGTSLFSSEANITIIDENSCAVYEASAYIRKLHESEIHAFLKKLQYLKSLAKQTGIYGLHYGYLSGIAIALLCSHFIFHQRKIKGIVSLFDLNEISHEEFVNQFCEYFSHYNYSPNNPISVPLKEKVYHRADMSPMQIINPVKPYGNVTRTMTKSSFQFLQYVFQHNFFQEQLQRRADSPLTLFVLPSSLLLGEGYKRTEIIAYCQSKAQVELFQQLFDSIYVRLILLFEENEVYPIGSNQSIVSMEDYSFHFSFYQSVTSSGSLAEINTVWSYLTGTTEKSFGKEIFLQIISH